MALLCSLIIRSCKAAVRADLFVETFLGLLICHSELSEIITFSKTAIYHLLRLEGRRVRVNFYKSGRRDVRWWWLFVNNGVERCYWTTEGFSILTLTHKHLFIIHTKNVCLGVRPRLTHYTFGNFPHFHSTCLRHGKTELYRRVRGCVYFCTLMVDQFISPRDSLQDGDRQNWLRGRFWDRPGIRPHLNIWLMWLCRWNVMFLEPLLRVSWGSSLDLYSGF